MYATHTIKPAQIIHLLPIFSCFTTSPFIFSCSPLCRELTTNKHTKTVHHLHHLLRVLHTCCRKQPIASHTSPSRRHHHRHPLPDCSTKATHTPSSCLSAADRNPATRSLHAAAKPDHTTNSLATTSCRQTPAPPYVTFISTPPSADYKQPHDLLFYSTDHSKTAPPLYGLIEQAATTHQTRSHHHPRLHQLLPLLNYTTSHHLR